MSAKFTLIVRFKVHEAAKAKFINQLPRPTTSVPDRLEM
jgi:hypothetical protein